MLQITCRLRAGLINVKHSWTRKLFGRKQRDVAAESFGASCQAVFMRNEGSSLSDVQQIFYATRSGQFIFPKCVLRSANLCVFKVMIAQCQPFILCMPKSL